MDIEEPITYRIQCVECKTFLSNPFKLKSDSIIENGDIKIERYKGDNLNYHAENDYKFGGKILYSFIYCLFCHQKVGYWMSQASLREKNNINHIFFFRRCINLIQYDKNSVTEEEDKKFQQEEVFYNSEFLTNDVINYAKAHIDNFIKNVKIFEQQRTEAKHCYDSFDRKITTLKELFVKIIKDPGKDKLNLGIDFSKQEISEARLRNKLRLKKYEREKQEKEKKDEKEKKQENEEKENKKEKEEEEKKEEQDEDSKSNGKKIDIEENGQNIDNNINADNNEDINRQNQNGGTNYDIIEISNNIKSDIYIDVEIKPKNNKEPSKNLQRIKKIKKKK